MPQDLLSIIVPVYNEEQLIGTSLPKIFELKIAKEVIIVNDGSTDQTGIILQDLQQKFNFQLISETKNKGKGFAVRQALKQISGNYFIIYDADDEYQLSDVVSLFEEIQKINLSMNAPKSNPQPVVLYGSRWLHKPALSAHYLVNKFLTALTNLLFSSHLTDMETCLKLIPSTALKDLKLKGRRFEIEPEITAQLLKANYLIKELPIQYTRRNYQQGKKIKARDGLLAIYTLIKERLI